VEMAENIFRKRVRLLFAAVWMAGVIISFFLCFNPDFSSPENKLGVGGKYPSVSDLRQDDHGGPNHSIYIDNAIRKTLTDPDSFKFISATLWTQDSDNYGPKAWTCQAEYKLKKSFGGCSSPNETAIIFDPDGCRVLNPILEKKSIAMTDSERKTLLYTIKTIHDPLKNPK
jgi:hypothetical protein